MQRPETCEVCLLQPRSVVQWRLFPAAHVRMLLQRWTADVHCAVAHPNGSESLQLVDCLRTVCA